MTELNNKIKILQETIKADPNNFKTYFDLGNTFIQLKKYDLALNNYKKSIKLNKNFVPAYINLGNTYKIYRNYKESVKFYNKALEFQPNHIKALYNIASTYFEEGKLNKAIEYYEKVLKIDEKNIASLNNLGIIFSRVNNYRSALNCYIKAVKLNDKFSEPQTNIGNIYYKLGELKEAEKAYKKVFELLPDKKLSYINLLIIYEFTNQLINYKEILLLAKKKFPGEMFTILFEGILNFREKNYQESIDKLEFLSFEEERLEKLRLNNVAKSYDRIENSNKAFDFFKKRNNLKLKSSNISKKHKKKFINILEYRKNYFTKKNLNKWKKLSYPKLNFNLVFLVGFPRSGTTLLNSILNAHPKIKVIDEKPMLPLMIEKNKTKGLKSLEFLKYKEIEDMRKEYINELKKYEDIKDQSITFIDKNPFNMIYAGEIRRTFPDSKIILSLRHPKDCVLSCYMQDFNTSQVLDNFLKINDATNLYKKVFDLWFQYEKLFDLNSISIKYENLVENYEKQTKKILKFIKLNWHESLSEYIKNTKSKKILTPSYDQVNEPIYRSAIGRWKKYEKYLSRFNPKLKEIIKKLNY